ncbi:thioesterase II family protein [Nocardiopsis ansamitocini]|uniref:Thioesterase n=1 Tax=Nocardiopsis ansamitocini TaxID=1670832 RepID=A0A9W6UIH9_9ACTN|nr:alpha/beta fold hydrolase [Nocardiopsis ansamitocini]GLU47719.1 thioesterase [Nocardiopsis ansamitocini]
MPQAYTMSTQPGLYRFTGAPAGANANLVCFCHAGGAPNTYQSWAAPLAGRFQVWAARLNPRDFAELGSTGWDRYAELQAQALLAVDGPITLYGHSMGSIAAYETARALRRLGRDIDRLVVSGRNAPDAEHDHDFPDDPIAMVRAVHDRYGGIPEQLFDEPELMKLFGTAMVADFQTIRAYTHVPGTPLAVPLTVVAGESDPAVTEEGLQAWSAHTNAEFRLERVQGGHFLTDIERPALLALLD